ncbi:MAG: hypothetical protein QOF09_3017 [Alphaproteobacteria bacterium]|jgi:hypothetical protein|nr:hypothetical protein [Alphaproteobacteria bacterium]
MKKPKSRSPRTVFPSGLIVAWYARSGAIPSGWAICDGTNGTPDLRGKFLRGVSNFADVGGTGGSDSFTINVGQDGRKGSDYHWGSTPWSQEPNPARGNQTYTVDNRPPYFDILYIMAR